MIRIPPGPNTLLGPDFSHYEPYVDFDKVKQAGYYFCSLKVTDGAGYIDPTSTRRWQILKAVGIARIAYHFWRPNVDPTAQALWFIAAIGGAMEKNDIAMFDWELQQSDTDPVRVREFLDVIETKLKKRMLIYGPADLLDGFNCPWLSKYPLFISDPGAAAPLVPRPWKGWQFWQWTFTDQIPGVSVPCDCDLFNGTQQDLLNLAQGLNL